MLRLRARACGIPARQYDGDASPRMPQPITGRSADTDADAEACQLDLLRRASAARRAALALSFSATVIGLARRAIRRAMPDAPATEVGLRFVELHYGRELAAELRHHLESRSP